MRRSFDGFWFHTDIPAFSFLEGLHRCNFGIHFIWNFTQNQTNHCHSPQTRVAEDPLLATFFHHILRHFQPNEPKRCFRGCQLLSNKMRGSLSYHLSADEELFTFYTAAYHRTTERISCVRRNKSCLGTNRRISSGNFMHSPSISKSSRSLSSPNTRS